MSGNINNNERSMNGIISINAEDLKVNNLDAENIQVQNLEILNSLVVNTTTLSPSEIEQLDGINTNETIQQQINNISNNFVTLDTTQTITGNKTFSGTTTLTGNLDVSGISITPQEISFLDGLQSNIQTQLDNAGITNSVTLNTDQIITGKKTFTQSIGLPSVNYETTNATFQAFMSSPTTLTYGDVSGVFSVQDSIIIGPGVDSTIISESERTGTPATAFTSGEVVLTTSGTPSTPIQQSVSAYFKGGQPVNISVPSLGLRNWFVFESLNNITQRVNNAFTTALRWNTNSSITIPNYIDDFVYFTNYTTPNGFLTDINSVIFESNSNANGNVSPLLPNITARTGYIVDNQTFIQKPYVPSGSVSFIPVGDFIEGTGFIAPCKTTAITNYSYTISSPSAITPTPAIRSTITGYIDDLQTIYYNTAPNNVINDYELFVKGICSPETMILNGNNNSWTINFNSVLSSVDYTKSGYIQDGYNIVFEDSNNLQVGQFVKNDSVITKGRHYITALTNGVATLDDLITPLSPSPSTTIDGYLFTNNVLVGTGFVLNEYITGSEIIDNTTKVSIINPTFVNLSTSNNTPTPNNKTYTGFSPSSTEFYYNNDNTNVAIDYYLKNNAIQIPTTDHLITSVDTANKKLTSANLPISSPTLSVNGYTNLTLNSIITETAQSINVGDGIDSTLINTGSRFVSFVNGLEINVSGTLNSIARIFDTKGFCSQSNESIVYDPNTRLGSGDFLVDYDLNAIPINSIITSITSLGFDIYQVGLSSSLTFTPSTNTTITDTYKPTSNTLAVNSSALNNKVYQVSGDYRYITGTTANPYVYNTNDSGSSDLVASSNKLVVIQTQTNEIYLLSTLNDSGVSFSTLVNKYIQENTLVPTECFLKTANTIELKVMNDSIKIVQNLSASFLPLNYGNGNNNPYRVGTFNNEVAGNAIFLQYKISGVILYINRKNEADYTPQTGDIILDCTGTSVAFDLKAKKSVYSGLFIDMMNFSGTAPLLTNLDPSVPVAQVAPTVVNLYLFITPTLMIFNQNAQQSMILVYFFPPNNSISISIISGVRPVVIGGQTRYEYTLLRGIPNVSQTIPFDLYPSWFNLRNASGAHFTFSSVKFRTPAGLQYNFYTPNSSITVPDSQVEYESVPSTNVNIYSGFDSYNSYEKKTFQQLTPIQFDIYNGTTFQDIEQVSFNTFEKLDFSIFTLDTYLAQTSVEVSFKPSLVQNDTFITNSELINGYSQALLLAPTISNVTINGLGYSPTFTSPIIFLNHPSQTSFFYTNQMVFRTGDPGSNIFFNSTSTQVIGRNFSVQPGIFAPPVFEVNNTLTRFAGYAGSYIDAFAFTNDIYMDWTPSGVNDYGVRLQCKKNGTGTGSGQFFIYASNFRSFKPVHNNNAGFGNSTVRTLATNITFNGGVLLVIFNTSGFRNGVGLGQFVLRCMNSRNQQIWSVTSYQYFNTRSFHLNFGSNTFTHTGIPAQTGAYLQLVRNNTGLIQDLNDFTNVSITELPIP